MPDELTFEWVSSVCRRIFDSSLVVTALPDVNPVSAHKGQAS